MIERRAILKASGLGLIAATINGTVALLSPREARSRGANFKVLSVVEVACLEALAEALVPGARLAGVSHYIDEQLVKEPEDSLLLLRYLNVEGPAWSFYQTGLASLDALAVRESGGLFARLSMDRMAGVVRRMQSDQVTPWDGPAAQIVYTAIRSDAIDVVYDGDEGMARLGIPVMGHAPAPPTRW